jgi:hypothetical protein
LAIALWDLSVAMIEKVMGKGSLAEFTQQDEPNDKLNETI